MSKRKTTKPNIPTLEPAIRNPAQLGAALLRFRKQENWTQGEVGEKSGIKQSIVSQVESGKTGTRLGTVFKLFAALDLEVVIRKRKKTLGKTEG